jgi:Flp pilus assembly protein TadD
MRCQPSSLTDPIMNSHRPASLQKLRQQALRQMKNPVCWRAFADACLAAGETADAISALEQLRRLLPKDWLAGFQLANQYYARSKFPEALDLYLLLMEQNPGSWEVRNNLALLLKQLDQRDLAEQCWLEAIALKPDYVDALSNLGNLYRDRQQFDKAVQCLGSALELRPDSAELLTNLGLLLKEQGDLAGAINAYRLAAAQPVVPAELPFNYAIALIQSGEYKQGFAWYEKRWQLPRLAERRQAYDALMPEWQGEFLAGKTLLVWNEQGLGDMIQMARYLPEWKRTRPDCRVLLRVDPSLLRLFAGLAGVDQIYSSAEPMPQADFHLSAMSFPFRMLTRPDTIPALQPYLCADAGLSAEWSGLLGSRGTRPRVGLVWQSGAPGIGLSEFDRKTRSLAPEQLHLLLQSLDVDWISLQHGVTALPDDVREKMHVPARPVGDFADTAAILSQLDALVSVDTAAAHLGGALGVPTLVLMRASGGNLFPSAGEQMPWYPGMRLLRQTALYDWEPVLALLPRALSRILAK